MLSDSINRKFIESFNVDDWEVETDTGWSDISQIHKTIEYDCYEITTEKNKKLIAADDHIIFTEDYNEIFLKDALNKKILTKDGAEIVTSVKNLNTKENMYDLSLNDQNHRFYTNDILSHNSITVISYLLWLLIFRDRQSVAILANKAQTARKLLSLLKMSYEHLPKWLQQGVVEWNKSSIELENGSTCIANSTSSTAARGGTFSALVLDEFAFVPENIAEDFFTSVYPTITSGNKTKVIMISTPNGMNLFHKFWIDAEEGRNAYKTYVATWRCRPDRDEKWAKETLANMGELKFSQEFEVLFLGSQDTLISGSKLAKLTFINPVTIHRSLKIYEHPNPSHMYMITVDCGKGKEQDYSTFVVIDITEFPYKVSAVYRDNKISPILYPEEIRNCATMYNDAFVLIEVNDVGYQVATTLQRELEYENMLTTTSQKTKQVLRIGCGYSYKHNMGVITSKSVKAIGCSNLKSIIEGDQLIINDHDILSELTTFIGSKNTFAADDGHHDDLVMNLVLFSWAYNQEAFKDLTDLNLRERLMSLKEEADEESTLPIGFKCDGSPDSEEDESLVADGCVWEADPVEVYDQTTSYADIEED